MIILKIPRVVIGGSNSGSGKTTVVCALVKALKDRGLKVSAAKCGPDFIDPMFHGKILGVPSTNIDLYFQDRHMACSLLAEHASGSDITLIEGVMGYYDGISYDSDKASTYEVASVTDTPAVIVMNAKGASLTVSAIIRGILKFRKNSGIKAVILNNITSGGYKMIKSVIEKETGIKVIGYLPYDRCFSFESRYLGLKIPNDKILETIEVLGKTAAQTIDIDELISISEYAGELPVNDIGINFIGNARIAVALDEAFCFYYKYNLELLKKMGAEISYFSPIKDRHLPDNTDGIILGGGYPELYAEELSANVELINQIRTEMESGMPCLAECGGFMYLNKYINGKKMVGIFDGNSFNTGKLTRFGYIELKSDKRTFDGIKGHEFHYWDTDNNGDECLAVKPNGKRSWQCMRKYKNVLAGFPHLYYYSKPEFAEEFIKKCRRNKI